MSVAYERKMRGAGELCRGQGIAFIPIVAESLGGLHGIAVREIKKIGAALARHTGEDEGQTTSHCTMPKLWKFVFQSAQL